MVESVDRQSMANVCIAWHLHCSEAVWLPSPLSMQAQVVSRHLDTNASMSITFPHCPSGCSLYKFPETYTPDGPFQQILLDFIADFPGFVLNMDRAGSGFAPYWLFLIQSPTAQRRNFMTVNGGWKIKPVSKISGCSRLWTIRFPFVVLWIAVEVSAKSVHFIGQFMYHPELYVAFRCPNNPKSISEANDRVFLRAQLEGNQMEITC